MEQHPVPQNILDIEFKLFSKFTIKEFAYIAIGGGFGFIFIYAMSSNPDKMPPIIAIPVFIISLGIGLFLALVPINDQKADVYFRNYISAITNPTLRVWRSKYFKKDDVKTVHEQGKNFGPSNIKKGANLNMPKAKLNKPAPTQPTQIMKPVQQNQSQQLRAPQNNRRASVQPQATNLRRAEPTVSPTPVSQPQAQGANRQSVAAHPINTEVNSTMSNQLQSKHAQNAQTLNPPLKREPVKPRPVQPQSIQSQPVQSQPVQPQPVQPPNQQNTQQFRYKPAVHNPQNGETSAPKPPQQEPKPNINNQQNLQQRVAPPEVNVKPVNSTPPKVEINKNPNINNKE